MSSQASSYALRVESSHYELAEAVESSLYELALSGERAKGVQGGVLYE